MALQQINVATPNSNTGDTLRDAFVKVNANTTDLLLSVTTSADSTFNGIKVGKGAGNISSNTAIGSSTLANNTTGSLNTAVGQYALVSNQTGINNSAFGTGALGVNLQSSYNSAFGSNTLAANISGTDNTAMGINALMLNTIGSNNTAFGAIAGTSVTTQSNTTCLGSNAQATASNQVNLGNTSVTSLRCNVTSITSLSDKRDKKDILEISEGLDFVSKLKPVTFTWNQRDGNREGIKAAGFIAQDLLELQNDSSIGENLDLVSDSDPEQLEARYTNLMPVMIKAIQELKAEIELLKAK